MQTVSIYLSSSFLTGLPLLCGSSIADKLLPLQSGKKPKRTEADGIWPLISLSRALLFFILLEHEPSLSMLECSATKHRDASATNRQIPDSPGSLSLVLFFWVFFFRHSNKYSPWLPPTASRLDDFRSRWWEGQGINKGPQRRKYFAVHFGILRNCGVLLFSSRQLMGILLLRLRLPLFFPSHSGCPKRDSGGRKKKRSQR